MAKRDVLQGVALGLGEFGLVDPGGLAQQIARLGVVDNGTVAKAIRSSGLRLPPSVCAETVAGRVVARISGMERDAAAPGGCTVLFLAACPLDQERLSIDDERRAIRTGLRGTTRESAIVFETRWAVRPDDLLECANEVEPDVLHFSGHGGGVEGIALADDDGDSRFVSGDLLLRVVRQFRHRPKVCVLNACFSEEQARHLVKSVPCVIGMGDEIGDLAGIAFARAFYRAIASGRSVEDAFEQGRLSLELEETEEESTPRLLESRRGIASKTVLL